MKAQHATKRTFPDRTRHVARVLESCLVSAAGRVQRLQVVENLDRPAQSQTLVGRECDANARRGDLGTLTLVYDEDAGLGAFWKFTRD